MRYLFFIFLYLQTPTHAQSCNEDLRKAIGEVISNDYNIVVIDSSLQVVYKDTLAIVKSKLEGTWRYQGVKKLREQDLIDTLSRICYVKNGEIYRSENGKYQLTEDVVESYFNFSEDDYSWINKVVFKVPDYYTNLHRPFIYLVYYQREIGVLFKSGLYMYFYPVKFLSDKVLILKQGEDSYWCYLRL